MYIGVFCTGVLYIGVLMMRFEVGGGGRLSREDILH